MVKLKDPIGLTHQEIVQVKADWLERAVTNKLNNNIEATIGSIREGIINDGGSIWGVIYMDHIRARARAKL